jgi:transposase
MAGRPLRIQWQDGHEARTLWQRYRAERDPTVRVRLHLLWRVRTGDTVTAAAVAVGVSLRAATQWLARYRAAGLAPLCTTGRGPGRRFPSKLTPAQWEQVRAQTRQATTRTVRQAVAWIAATWGVRYRETGLRRALHRHRLRLKVPRPRSNKADPARQAAWKRGGSPTR